MAAKKIRVRFKQFSVIKDADLTSGGEWVLSAEVKRLPANTVTAFGDSTAREVNTGQTVTLNWTTDLEIDAADTQIEIFIQGHDEDTIANDDLGSIKITLNNPIMHGYDLWLRSSEQYYAARVQVDVLEQTAGSGGAVTTIRERFESEAYSTIHDEMCDKMVHICPVVPVPWSTGIPPLAKGVKPLSASAQVNLGITAAGAKLNGLVNPALIPVISPSSTGFNDRCARIRITQYRPDNLDLSKIIWKAASGNVKFWHAGAATSEVKGGQEVKAYGVLGGASDEACKIEARYDMEGQPLLAVFRAWVGKIKYVWYRVNIITCSSPTVSGVPIVNPTWTAADAVKYVKFANQLLWQSGIALVPDSDTTCYNGASLSQPGIFTISSATNYTFNVQRDRRMVAPLLNSRSGIMNITFIHSCRGKPTLLGAATDRSLSAAESTANLAGSPSTSWVQPSGVWPDSPGTTVAMKRMGPSSARADDLKDLCGDKAIDKICAFIALERDKQFLATGSNLLAHELGHVLGLHHRGSGAWKSGKPKKSTDNVDHMAGPNKGLGHPWDENIMTYGDNAVAQDFDLLQTQVMRGHALLKNSPPGVPAPKPKPEDKPIPAAWTPSEADVILMQEYLSGKRPGLKNCGYDLGSTGPDGDGVDGDYGPKTKAAVRAFQRAHGGLVVDGIYGPNTRAAFDEEINGAPV